MNIFVLALGGACGGSACSADTLPTKLYPQTHVDTFKGSFGHNITYPPAIFNTIAHSLLGITTEFMQGMSWNRWTEVVAMECSIGGIQNTYYSVPMCCAILI